MLSIEDLEFVDLDNKSQKKTNAGGVSFNWRTRLMGHPLTWDGL